MKKNKTTKENNKNDNFKNIKNGTIIHRNIDKNKEKKKKKILKTHKKKKIIEKENNKVYCEMKDDTKNEEKNQTKIVDSRFTFDDILWKNYKKEESKKGVIYLSNIPLGMSVTKIKDFFSEYGNIDNIHLNKMKFSDISFLSENKSNKIIKYIDGFIEFSNKKDAIKVEKLLNNQLVGGKKRKNIARDYLWHIKYLKDFTWNDLTERALQRHVAKQEKFKFAVKKIYKDYANYLEHHQSQSNRISANNNDDTETQNTQKLPQPKKRTWDTISMLRKDSIIKDPLQNRKNKIIEESNIQECQQISSKKYSKQKNINKPISADFAKLLL